jgi:hypothetical protein
MENTALSRIVREQGLEILPDNAQWKNRFKIESESSNRLYVIAQNKSKGHWGCSCMGWIRNRKCKHLTALQPILDSVSKPAKKQKQIA